MFEQQQVFDGSVLDTLADEMCSAAIARHFAAQYLGLLSQRVERLSWAVNTGNFDEAHDAVLSLKVTSATVGACRLSQVARRIEECVIDSAFGAAARLLSEAVDAADHTRAALRSYLISAT